MNIFSKVIQFRGTSKKEGLYSICSHHLFIISSLDCTHILLHLFTYIHWHSHCTYTHICGRKTWLAQRRITSAFKLGRECYLNNSFRSVDPQRSLPMYRNVYVCGPVCVCARLSMCVSGYVCAHIKSTINFVISICLLPEGRQAG